MKRYFKIISNGCLEVIGSGAGGQGITEAEYNEILSEIRNKPTAEIGYDYRLKEDLTWELYELPPMPPEDDEDATAEDYEEALGRFGV